MSRVPQADKVRKSPHLTDRRIKGREECGVFRAVQILLIEWRPCGRKAQKMRQSWEQGLKRGAMMCSDGNVEVAF